MHARFGLTLMMNHACNLRCAYCYTGDKFRRAMSPDFGCAAIDRALNSLHPNGTLELGFFGGEPLIEADTIIELIDHRLRQSQGTGVDVELSLTTNGTIDGPDAWSIMARPEMQLAISHDGLPEIHDRHRVTIDGQGTSSRVLQTIARLQDVGKAFRVVLVVRPDNVAQLPAGIEFLFDHGVRQFDPSLDLWATWSVGDGERLKLAIRDAADFWAARLPDCSVSWFDAKAARLGQVSSTETARCGFGHAEIAVAPSGHLYPCERLIGEDRPTNPMRLPGHVLDGGNYLGYSTQPGKSASECTQCVLNSICSTTCRCSNYVRTADISRPDRLLCLWDQTCVRETARVLEARMVSFT